MWITKLLIFPVEIRIFCPKTTKFGPKLAFLVDMGLAMQAYSMPCCGSVGGCGAQRRKHKRAVPGHVMKMISFLDRVRMMIFFIGVQEVINLTNNSLNGEL